MNFAIEKLAERTLKLNEIVNLVQAHDYGQELGIMISEMRQMEEIQRNMLSILSRLEVSWGKLTNTVSSSSDSIGQLSTDKEVPGGESGQLATPVLQDVVAAMLVDSLESDGINPAKIKINDSSLGRIVLGISFALATFELADSEDVVSRLVGAPIAAFLAGYTYTGSLTVSLVIGGITLALGAITELSKYVTDELVKYINQKWDLNLPSLEEMGMENYSFIDFVKMAFSPEGIQMQVDHPLMGLDLMGLVLFGPDFSWEKFWEEQKDKAFTGFFAIFAQIGENLGILEPDILKPFSDLWEKIKEIWINSSTWFFENIINPIIGLFENFKETVGSIFEGLSLIIQAVWSKIVEGIIEYLINPIIDLCSAAWEKIQPIWSGAVTWFEHAIERLKSIWESLWDGIKSGAAMAMNAMIGGVEAAINWVIRGINKLLDGFNKIVQWAAHVVGEDWGGITLLKEVSFGRIQTYGNGGFPNFTSPAIVGESGPELIGGMYGRPAIANHNSITEGIEDATYRGFIKAMSEQNQNDPNVNVILQGDAKGIFRVVQEENQRESSRLQRAALSW